MQNNHMTIGIIIMAFLIGAVSYFNLPDTIAIHWTNGEPDQFISKLLGIWIMPILMVISQVLFVFSANKSKLKHENPTFLHALSNGTLVFLLLLQAALLLFNLNASLNIEVICAILAGLLIIVLGNYMPAVGINALYGVRTPWSMKNKDVWRLTQRFSSKILVLAGFLIILVSLVFPAYILPIMLILVLTAALISVIASYYFFKKAVNKKQV